MTDTQPGIAPTEIAERVEALREARFKAEKEACSEELSTEWLGRYAAYREALPIIEAQRDLLREAESLFQDVWDQFSLVNSRGERHDGGLSVLEDVSEFRSRLTLAIGEPK